MIKTITKRWTVILFISLFLNIFLGGLFIANKYFKDKNGLGFRKMVYSVPWARHTLGDEVKPLAQKIFRAHRGKIRNNGKIRIGIYKNIDTALTREPFDKRELMKAFDDLKENFQITQTEMHSMMTEFSAQLTKEQRKILVKQAKRVYEKRHERRERRRKRFKETENNK